MIMSKKNRGWQHRNWLVIDTETTGLDPKDSKIIDLAAVTFESGAPTSVFEQLLNPGAPIPEESTAIHGISDEMVQGKPRFHEIADTFLDLVEKADVLVAYNWPFDARFLEAETGPERWQEAIKEKCILDPLVVVRFDSVGRYWKGRGRHRLTEVCARLEIDVDGDAHRARTDAVMTGHVLWNLRQHLPRDRKEANDLIQSQRERQDAEFQAWKRRQSSLFS